jgi:hypothetical protein
MFTGPKSSAYRLPTLPGARLHDDVALRAAPASTFPVGPAQAPIKGTTELGAPGTDAYFEFPVRDGFDNWRMHIVVEDIEGDVDLWLERMTAAGQWQEVAQGANGFDVAGPETLDTGRHGPGAYRVRVTNFASVPGEISLTITFRNQAGDIGRAS